MAQPLLARLREKLPGVEIDLLAPEWAAATRRFGLEGPYAVLCPGAEYGPAKRWPYFKELAQCLGIEVVLLGSGGDRESGAGIPGNNLIGKTTLDEAIDLIAGAAFV